MKRRNSKKTGVIALIAGLSSVTLVSIGFASWVISGGDTTEVTGTISVDEVDDGRYLIAKTGDYAPKVSNNISFGCAYETAIENAWLTAKDSTCNLTATVTFYVANLVVGETQKQIGTDLDIEAEIEATGTNADKFNEAVGAGLVEKPTLTKNIGYTVYHNAKQTIEVGGKNYDFYKVTLDLEFKWGTYFGKNDQNVTTNTNPYVFYNTGKTAEGKVSTGSETTWADDALDKLGKIRKANGANFKLTLTTSVHTSNTNN